MTLTNVEKELIATQIHDLDKSFERVVTDHRKDKFSPQYLEHLHETRVIIQNLKKYWVDQQ